MTNEANGVVRWCHNNAERLVDGMKKVRMWSFFRLTSGMGKTIIGDIKK